jgi:predicted O-methyltransferase YrrM
MSSPIDARLPILTPEIGVYIDRLCGEPSALCARLADNARNREFPLIGHTSGRWLELLTRAIGGKRVFEFGSGFGFSAYYFARAVGPEGQVLGSECDAHELDDFERLYAGEELKSRIDIQIGSALEIFAATDGMFDAVLIDIDKEGYSAALDAAIPRVRKGGLILADNVLWGGKTAHKPQPEDTSTLALQAFNQQLFADSRLLTGILPAGDGLSVSLVQS